MDFEFRVVADRIKKDPSPRTQCKPTWYRASSPACLRVQASGDYSSWFAARLRNFAEEHVGFENDAGTETVARKGLKCAVRLALIVVSCSCTVRLPWLCAQVPGALVLCVRCSHSTWRSKQACRLTEIR